MKELEKKDKRTKKIKAQLEFEKETPPKPQDRPVQSLEAQRKAKVPPEMLEDDTDSGEKGRHFFGYGYFKNQRIVTNVYASHTSYTFARA